MARKYQHTFENHLYLQRVSPRTREAYLRAVAQIAAFHSLPPQDLTNDQIQDFLLYSIQERELAWSSCNVLFCGLKKYYLEFLKRPQTEFSLPPRTRSKKIPMLLSQEEVARLLLSLSNLKHRALLSTVYGSGLRVSEVVKLKAEHIDSSRMMIRVEQGKGRKDRYTILSKNCLHLLKQHWCAHQPEKWLFFGKDKQLPMSIGTAQHVYYNAKRKANVTKGRGIHTLRHCFASHLLEAGTEIYAIKKWMGHISLKTTYKYIHLSPDYLSKIKSPLDILYEEAEA